MEPELIEWLTLSATFYAPTASAYGPDMDVPYGPFTCRYQISSKVITNTKGEQVNATGKVWINPAELDTDLATIQAAANDGQLNIEINGESSRVQSFQVQYDEDGAEHSVVVMI